MKQDKKARMSVDISERRLRICIKRCNSNYKAVKILKQFGGFIGERSENIKRKASKI